MDLPEFGLDPVERRIDRRVRRDVGRERQGRAPVRADPRRRLLRRRRGAVEAGDGDALPPRNAAAARPIPLPAPTTATVQGFSGK